MGGPKWKREVYPDHKFDYIDVKSFKQHGFLLWAGYVWVYIDILKSLAVYVLDTQTAIFLLAFNRWASQVKPAVSLSISRWIFSGCIIFSFLLLAKDWWTARKIIRSRDISFAYTNMIANRWYSVRKGYPYYCLFDKLGECRHFSDSIAFFVFFSFKGWKRLLLAEGPRQVLNAITLYSVAKDQNFSFDIHVYQQEFTTLQGVVLSFMCLTVTIWALSAIRLLVAAFLYWPLLVCHIRGNLKEYCCHKVDKRITQLLADRAQQRRRGEGSDKKKAATFSSEAGVLPTLPKVELDGDGGSILSMPLYPLSRSDSVDSRHGLLSRAESFGTTSPLTRTQTNPSSYPLMKMDSGSTYHQRSDSVTSNAYSLHRADTVNTTHYEIQSPGYQLSRTDTTSTGLTRLTSNSSNQPQRQPTLPHLHDFSQNRGPPRSSSRQGSLPSVRPPMSSRGYGPPSRAPTIDDRPFSPPPRTNTAQSTREFTAPARSQTPQFGPTRSNTAQSTREFAPTRTNTAQSGGFGPPPRANTAQSMRSVGRPVYEEFGTGYGVPR